MCISRELGMHHHQAKFGSICVKPAQINEKASPNSEKITQKTTKFWPERPEVFAFFREQALDDCFFVSLTTQRKPVWPTTLLPECLKSRPRKNS